MNRLYLFFLFVATFVVAGCNNSSNTDISANDVNKTDTEREAYVRRAREQDSLRIVHYQDSIEKAKLLALEEERKAAEAETERKINEEKKRKEDEAEAKRKAEEEAKRKAEEEAKRKAKEVELNKNKKIQGHEYVDLGLSVLWATCNVGATDPHQIGDYFSWGEVVTKTDFSWDKEHYKHYDKDLGKSISGTMYDAATQEWGRSWRMPTKTEMQELLDKCVWERATVNGTVGYKIKAKNGNQIFLPATGMNLGPKHGLVGNTLCYYWTGTLSDEYDFNAYCLSYNEIDDPSRAYGLCIRPVSNLENAK